MLSSPIAEPKLSPELEMKTLNATRFALRKSIVKSFEEKPALESEMFNAYLKLSLSYLKGEGTPYNPVAAFKNIKKATEKCKNIDLGWFILGECYLLCIGTLPSKQQAFDAYLKANYCTNITDVISKSLEMRINEFKKTEMMWSEFIVAGDNTPKKYTPEQCVDRTNKIAILIERCLKVRLKDQSQRTYTPAATVATAQANTTTTAAGTLVTSTSECIAESILPAKSKIT